MVDKINTELGVIVDVDAGQKSLSNLVSKFVEANTEIKTLSEKAEFLNQTFNTIDKTTKGLLTSLKALSLGSLGNQANIAGVSQFKTEQKGSDQGSALAVAKAQVSYFNEILALTDKINKEKLTQFEIQKGIVNQQTLEYQRDLAKYNLGQTYLSQAKNKAALEKEAAIVYANAEIKLANFNRLEAERLAILKQQTLERNKAAAAAAKAAADAEKTAAKEAAKAAADAEKTAAKEAASAAKAAEKAANSAAGGGGGSGSDVTKKSMLDLLVIQAKLLANYKLINTAITTFGSGISYVRELDKAFYQLQAIGDLTTKQMVELKNTIIEVGNSSRFSAVDIAGAAVTLAQAGFSGEQIKSSIKAISNLATAAGTELPAAVDIVTSVLNVFNYQASQSGQVANILTAALNESKLSITQLGLGIQYASNIAADANISFTEMVATFGVLADAGIKSGSTIGTGYRKLLTDLEAPSDKLKKRMSELGLTMADIDVRTKGLAGTLKVLQNAGFTTADALNTLDVRAAATYSALGNGLDTIELTEQRFQLSQAAIKGNETQMQSLDSSIKQLQSSLGSLIYSVTGDLLKGFTNLTKSVTSLVQGLSGFKDVIRYVIDALAIGLISRFVIWTAAVSGLSTVLKLIPKVMPLVISALEALGIELTGLSALLLANPLVAWAAGITLAGAAIYGAYKLLSSGTKDATQLIDENNTKLNEAKEEFDKYADRGRELTKTMEGLRDQHDYLNSNVEALRAKVLEAQNAFGDYAGAMDLTSKSAEELAGKLAILQKFNYKEELKRGYQYIADLNATNAAYKQSVDLTQNDLLRKSPGLISQVGKSSLPEDTQKSLLRAIELGTNPNRTAVDSVSLAGLSGKNGILESIKDLSTTTKSDRALIQTIINSTQQQATLTSEIATNNVNKKAAEDKIIATVGDSALIDQLNQLRTSLDGATAAQKEQLGKATTASEVENLATGFKKELDDFKARRDVQVAASSPDSDQNKINQGVIAKLQDTYQKTLDAGIIMRKDESDRLIEQEKTRQENLKIQEQTASRKDLPQIQSNFISAREAERDAEITKQIQDLKSSDYLAKHYPTTQLINPKTGQDTDAKKQILNKLETDIINKENDKAQKDILANNTKIAERLGKYKDAIDNKLLPTVEELKNAFEDLKEHTNHLLAQNAIPSKTLELQRKAYDIGDNRFNITDAERNIKDREKEKADAIQAQNDLNVYITQRQELLELIDKETKVQAELVEKAKAAGGTAKDLAGTSTGTRGGERFQGLKSQFKTSTDTLQAANKQLDEFDVKITEVRSQVDALFNAPPPKPFWDVFSVSLKNYMDESNRLAGSNVELGQGFTTMFNNIRDGLQNTVKDFATGTKSISQSFKGMARSIISDMLDIASKRAAGGLFSLLGSGLGSLFGDSAGAAPIQGLGQISVTDLPVPGLATGGIVTGGTPNKDSVLRSLMPGEAVLTKSAVSMIGEDTVNSLNSSSGKITSSSSPKAMNDNSRDPAPLEQKLYLVDNRSQIPSLGPNDVIMIVADNLSKSGSLKRAVRSAVS